MILKAYLIGASVHFLLNLHSVDRLLRKKSVTRDRATEASVNRELALHVKSLPLFVIWPVDFGKRIWEVLKIRP